MEDQNLRQSWNKRSKKWVLFRKGEFPSIVDMQPEKFEGVKVKTGKPENGNINKTEAPENGTEKKEAPRKATDENPPEKLADSQDSEDGWFGW